MVKISIEYSKDLHCTLRHEPSGASFGTDAPKDNQGKGETFSPTDLVAAALGSCMLTTMAIYAKRHGEELGPCQAQVLKEMVTDSVRRIGSLKVKITMPKNLSAEKKAVYERVALSCPVHKSLHPDVQIPVEFN